MSDQGRDEPKLIPEMGEQPRLEEVKVETPKERAEKAKLAFINSRKKPDSVKAPEPKKEELLNKAPEETEAPVETKAEAEPKEQEKTVVNSKLLAQIAREQKQLKAEKEALRLEKESLKQRLEETEQLRAVVEEIKKDPFAVARKYGADFESSVLNELERREMEDKPEMRRIKDLERKIQEQEAEKEQLRQHQQQMMVRDAQERFIGDIAKEIKGNSDKYEFLNAIPGAENAIYSVIDSAYQEGRLRKCHGFEAIDC